MPRRLVFGLVFLFACGARTALEVESLDIEPGFDTFPCRWSWGAGVDLSRGFEVDGYGGGIMLDQDTAHVVVGSPVALGLVLGLIGPELQSRAPEIFGRRSKTVGFERSLWVFEDGFCVGEGRTLAGELSGETVLVASGDISGCQVGPLHPQGMILAGHSASAGGALIGMWGPDGTDMRFAPLVPPSADLYPVKSGEDVYLLEQASGRNALHEIVLGSGLPIAQRIEGELLGLDADRLRGGVVFLVRRDGELLFERVAPRTLGVDSLLRLNLPADLGDGDLDRLVTTETDALFMLRDRLAWIPLSGSALRTTDPLPEGEVERARILMRPGQSVGGVVYQWRDGTEHVSTYRSLVCNR